ncbi:MAG TPA: PDZ domain-containing protein, partial [Planctomycetota bacterium]|nr:PDZ domain-containing protein [Planctomycetota bacterium]
EAHAAYGRRAKARRSAPLPDSRAVRTVEDLPPMRRRLEKGPQGCIHCHTVGDMRREWAEEQGTWRRDDVWRHPPAKRLGVTLDRDDQRRIAAVADASAAAEAGLRPGDRLTSVAGTPTAGEADVRFALDRLGPGPVEVPIAFIRGGEPRTAVLALSDGWRRGDALDLSWRNDLWPLRPNPGFGGKALTADEKRKLDLPADRFALRVGYLIDFGPHPEDGRAAKAAGLRVGDVVRGISGAPPDFVSERHFQAWWRLHVRPGATVVLDVTSTAGVRREVRLTALP